MLCMPMKSVTFWASLPGKELFWEKPLLSILPSPFLKGQIFHKLSQKVSGKLFDQIKLPIEEAALSDLSDGLILSDII